MTNHSVTDLFIPTPPDVQNLVFWIVLVCLVALCLLGIGLLTRYVLDFGASRLRSDSIRLTYRRRESLDAAAPAASPDESPLRLVERRS